jgi:hypothetical protein
VGCLGRKKRARKKQRWLGRTPVEHVGGEGGYRSVTL